MVQIFLSVLFGFSLLGILKLWERKKLLENVGVASEHSIMEMIPSDLRSEGKAQDQI